MPNEFDTEPPNAGWRKRWCLAPSALWPGFSHQASRFGILVIVVLVTVVAPGRAHAQTTDLDWQRGVIAARCAVPGDLRAPSREMARIKAERQARERCRTRLEAAVARVPLASGLEAGKASESSWPVRATDVDYGMDGSVAVQMVLPLDALRTVFAAPDPLIPMQAAGPAVLIIDARELPLKPAVGYRIADGTVDYRGPSVFFADEALARQDARVGNKAKVVIAQSARAGAIRVEAGALKGQLDARPLVVLLVSQDKRGTEK